VLDYNNFDRLKIGLASSEQIRAWSNGEVKKPETINYRTLKPEKDGLFCEKIFGPVKDWECYCGKYKRVRFKGIICERCGVEVTRSKVRRERMGHIELAAPVSHIWYFKGVPSRMGYLLDIAPKDLEKVLYFAAYIITQVNAEQREADLKMLAEELQTDLDDIRKARDEEIAGLERDRAHLIAVARGEAEATEEDVVPDGSSAEDKVKKLNKKYDGFLKDAREEAEDALAVRQQIYDLFAKLQERQLISDETAYRELKLHYGDYFRGGMGAEAIKDLLEAIDLEEESEDQRQTIRKSKGQKRARAIKRLKVTQAFFTSNQRPEWMILDAIPVIPPDLRPMVQLDGGRFATSDLNDLYRRVINRNNRLKRLLDLGAPEIIVNNEKRMLQEAVDALFDNGRRGRPVTGPGNRPLKSLSDMLKGKQGRFRQNLLGKRVDYSGRSVIVVNPKLLLHQCGLPKVMALELFKPFVMKRLVDLDHAQNIKSAKRMVERGKAVVWDVLDEVIREHPVLLNRAPTLHRLGIQAFEPILVEGKAIQIHPLVCTAFNADFDGDQMAVHLPLSPEAQAEARILMLSTNNVKSPAHGRPLATPTQDMVLGVYYLTAERPGCRGEGKVFASEAEAVRALDAGVIELHSRVKIRMSSQSETHAAEAVAKSRAAARAKPLSKTAAAKASAAAKAEAQANGSRFLETTVGRLLLNQALPPEYQDQFGFIDRELGKKEITQIIEKCAEHFGTTQLGTILDSVKALGFEYATRAGITIAVDDVKIPESKWKILETPERDVSRVERDYERGLITNEERHRKVVEIWTKATDDVAAAMEESFEKFNPVYMMAYSGARGNIKQIRQLAAMRGLVANPKGEIIDSPIKANFREGLTVLEYFISTHGARKGLADTALRTADSGYLTRRLVDVAQDVIVREDDCGTEDGIPIPIIKEADANKSLYGRYVAYTQKPIADPETGEIIVKGGDDATWISSEVAQRLAHAAKVAAAQPAPPAPAKAKAAAKTTASATAKAKTTAKTKKAPEPGVPETILVRSVLDCQAKVGVCRKCYGYALAAGKPVDIGEAVGIVAAQSIGEPGTQLTMRTFHTGGVAGEDITHGLPRVVELFEARKPKGEAALAEIGGKVSIDEADKTRKINIQGDDATLKTYTVPRRSRLKVADGQTVEAGDRLTEGSLNPHDLLRVAGRTKTQMYIVDEVQEVYKSQGVDIHDKHVELIVRQMLKRVTVNEPGDTDLLPGQLIDRIGYELANRTAVEAGGEAASAKDALLGITKASLATDSFLSAASFQETTRVLTDAAISGKADPLLGLKENVVIGKLIPAATGMNRYRQIKLTYSEELPEFMFVEPAPTALPAYGDEAEEEDWAAIGGYTAEPEELGAPATGEEMYGYHYADQEEEAQAAEAETTDDDEFTRALLEALKKGAGGAEPSEDTEA
jgi:DNA-directed RNA polymerase subunit beta'